MDNNPRTPVDKGKKVAEAPSPAGQDQPDQKPDQQPAPSVLSRITRSAAGLGRDVVAGLPRGHDLVGLGSDKAGSSSSAPSMSASEQAAGSSQAAQPTPSFAAGHSQQHVAAQEEAFAQFLDGVDIGTSFPGDLPEASGLAHASAGNVLSDSARPPPTASAVVLQESRDGLDVIQLLAGHAEDEPDYLRDIELAEDEVAGLQRALFGPSPADAATSTPWDHMLNFIPAFLRPRPDTEPGTTSHVSHAHETRSLVGVDDAAEATQQWLEQWRSVLTRYDDEVWGGLAPLVHEARQEMEQLAAASDTPAQGSARTKALNRLRQILGHLQGS